MPGWHGSTRAATLPPDWRTERRPRILARDSHRCTWLHRHPDGDGGFPDYLAGTYPPEARCTRPARDVDHWGNRHDHRDEALRSLCGQHHDRRSAKQGARASAAVRSRTAPGRLRPTEPHPGVRNPR